MRGEQKPDCDLSVSMCFCRGDGCKMEEICFLRCPWEWHVAALDGKRSVWSSITDLEFNICVNGVPLWSPLDAIEQFILDIFEVVQAWMGNQPHSSPRI